MVATDAMGLRGLKGRSSGTSSIGGQGHRGARFAMAPNCKRRNAGHFPKGRKPYGRNPADRSDQRRLKGSKANSRADLKKYLKSRNRKMAALRENSFHPNREVLQARQQQSGKLKSRNNGTEKTQPEKLGRCRDGSRGKPIFQPHAGV